MNKTLIRLVRTQECEIVVSNDDRDAVDEFFCQADLEDVPWLQVTKTKLITKLIRPAKGKEVERLGSYSFSELVEIMEKRKRKR